MNAPARILVTNRIHPEVATRLSEFGELVINPDIEPMPPEELTRQMARATAVMGFMTDRVDDRMLAGAPRLRIVACALKGHDNYDVEACTRRGVWVSFVPNLLTEPTAELALGLAIALGRNLRAGERWVRSGAFQGWRPSFYGKGLDGATVAVVGLGRVGAAILDRLQGFGCRRFLGVDPERADPRVEMATLAQAFAAADFLFLAVPLSERTERVVAREVLEGARPGLHLVNVGRGSVVDEEAVADALESGRLGGYAADVFAFEDWAVTTRPTAVPRRLLAHPATVLTPHIGSAVREVRKAIEMRAADNIVTVLSGLTPPDAVNRPTGAPPSCAATA